MNYTRVYAAGVFSNQYNSFTVSDDAWGFVAAMNQDVSAGADVSFNSVNVTNLVISETFGIATLSVTDPTFLVNSGESGAGVTAGAAGMVVDRGTLPNQSLLWNETGALAGKWSVGATGGTPGTDVFALAQAATATTGAIPAFNAGGHLDTAAGLSTSITTQLQNIDATVIPGVAWQNAALLNQDVSDTANVSFTSLQLGQFLTFGAVGQVTQHGITTNHDQQAQSSLTRVNCSAGSVNITLVPGVLVGNTYTVYFRSDTPGGSVVNILPNGTDKIEGSNTPLVLTVVGQHATLLCIDSGKWIVM